jgi:PPOX class probable F420-dependent enzyme
MTNASAGLAALNGKKYLNLETYRKSGNGVRTPVWFAAAAADTATANIPKLYVYTIADSGKAKRIRQNSAVKIAPCGARGNVTGQWIDAHAEIVGSDEFVRGMQLINRKYSPWKQILDLSARLFRRHERIMLVIRPV